MENPFEVLSRQVGELQTLVRQAIASQPGPAPVEAVEKPMTTQQAADFLGLSITALHHNKQIPRYKRGSHLFFYQSELDQYIRAGSVASKRSSKRKTPKTACQQ